MPITRGYCTLQEYKDYATARGQTNATDAIDDAMIEDLIEAASRTIDRMTGQTFYSRTAETRYFDIPDDDRELLFDDPLVSIDVGGFLNGDASVIAATEYKLLPINGTPKYGLRLKEMSTVYWMPDTQRNTEGVIAITGTWGYAATAPDDIKTLTEAIVLNIYRRRHGENVTSTSLVTAAGVVVTPEGIPEWGKPIIQYYMRRV